MSGIIPLINRNFCPLHYAHAMLHHDKRKNIVFALMIIYTEDRIFSFVLMTIFTPPTASLQSDVRVTCVYKVTIKTKDR